MIHKLTSEETTHLFESAKPYLKEISYTYLSKEERLKIIKRARFLDVRVRSEGREYYFEADFLKDLLSKLDDILTRKILTEKNTI